MVTTRADIFTANKKKQIDFSDFFNDFSQTPYGGELALITNEQDINQSIRNLIYTNAGERLFQLGIGGTVTGSLFELGGVPLNNQLIIDITNTITNYEPRAQLLGVTVQDITNSVNSNTNSVTIIIVYALVNNPNPITLPVILRFLR